MGAVRYECTLHDDIQSGKSSGIQSVDRTSDLDAQLTRVIVMKVFLNAVSTLLVFVLSSCADAADIKAIDQDKPRVVVLTDMGADPDDRQSLVRLLLYANQIDIEGLFATTSVWRKDNVKPEFISHILDQYEQVQPNLLLHEAGYPMAGELRAKLKTALPLYGMEGVGAGKDSDASERIIELLENDDSRPLWISVWGGVNVLAQALYTISHEKTPEEVQRLVAKLRVYSISDQDDSATWLRETFTNLFYIVSPGDGYLQATWSAIMTQVDGIDDTTISNRWLAANIQQGHGPLGAVYPDVAWGMEGDTPAFLSLIQNGLNQPERPDWGGWGGRYELRIPAFDTITDGHSELHPEPVSRPIWTDTEDTWTPYEYRNHGRPAWKGERAFTGNHVTLWRWRNDFQNDFAARMDWCINSYESANHPPVPKLQHSDHLKVRSGERVELDAGASLDPDGDSLSYLWFNYPEVGTYKKPIAIEGADNIHHVRFVAPPVNETVTTHFILRVTDKGTPSLSRYKRVIVTIDP